MAEKLFGRDPFLFCGLLYVGEGELEADPGR